MNLPVRVSIITICLISWASPASSQSSPWEAENEAGHKAYSLGHYAEAQKNYLAAIDDAKQSAGDDPQIVTPLNNLAALYMQQGRYSDAEQLYLQALSIRNNMSASEDSGTVIILSNLGALYLKEGKYPEAESLCKRALDLRAKLHTPEDNQGSSLLSNLGTLYFVEGKYPQAETLFQSALAMGRGAQFAVVALQKRQAHSAADPAHAVR